MVRTLQSVAAVGLLCSVASTICCTWADDIFGLRPRPGASSAKDEAPPRAKRSRHRSTVVRLVLNSTAILRLAFPSAARSTMRDRSTIFCGVFRAATQTCKTLCCSGLRLKAAGTFHIVLPVCLRFRYMYSYL